jgi:Zn-finger nucleic acid-binding protein
MADDQLMCPGCGGALTSAGYTERCKACDGAWIGEDALVGILQERASTRVFLPWQPREAAAGEGGRACAVCKKALAPVALGTILLDRCSEHGVWFDAKELAALLAEAKQFATDPEDLNNDGVVDAKDERGSFLDALARLFKR